MESAGKQSASWRPKSAERYHQHAFFENALTKILAETRPEVKTSHGKGKSGDDGNRRSSRGCPVPPVASAVQRVKQVERRKAFCTDGSRPLRYENLEPATVGLVFSFNELRWLFILCSKVCSFSRERINRVKLPHADISPDEKESLFHPPCWHFCWHFFSRPAAQSSQIVVDYHPHYG